MNKKDYIQEFIDTEKRQEPSKDFAANLMARIEATRVVSHRQTQIAVWRPILLSMAAASVLGVLVGNAFMKSSPADEHRLYIDDAQIENLSYYSFDDIE